MDIDKYIESMHPKSEKERKKLRKILSGYGVFDISHDVREIIVPKGYNIPFRGNLYNWSILMHTTKVDVKRNKTGNGYVPVVDEYGKLWVRIHNRDSAHDNDDDEVFFPVEDEIEADKLYDKVGPNILGYFGYSPYDKMLRPHFRFNDGPYLYFQTNDLTLSRDEMFDLLVESNVIYR